MPNKNILKEAFGEQGLTTPEVFNRITDSDIEKVIKGVLKKSFSEYTLEAYRHQGETEYINLNICKEGFDVDIKNFEQFERFRISTELATFRQQLFTELSKYLNVVNVKVGPYDYVKGSGVIKFNVTILMSDNNISDWVSGIRKKTESKKEFMGEAKVAKAFSTGDKDEFEVKNKLLKKGLNVSVIKDKEIKVKWDDKKHSEEGIRKMIGEREEKKLKSILESLYVETLTEAPPKKKGLDTRTENSLQKTIQQYNELTKELEDLEEQFRKSIQRKVDKATTLESKIYDTMKEADINLYVIDNIVAKMSKEFPRETTKYKDVIEEILRKVNEETAKMIQKILQSKKFKSKSIIPSQLSVVDMNPKKRTRKTESIKLQEGIIEWFKSLFTSFRSYLNNLTSAKKQLVSVAKKMGIDGI